jgi:hypothetical protein
VTDKFWESRDVLAHVVKLARARGAGPWSTLGVAMARAVASIPPTVTLPAIIGGRMSLNMFVALVGPSGGGKGASEAAAHDGLTFSGTLVPTLPIGSGEGIARTFRPLGTKADEPNQVSSVLLSSPEVDSLAAISSRQGATLSAELRKLYSGESLGFANSGKDTRNIVAAHSYRAGLLLGVQPLRSDVLLDASDGGLPQRFVWLPTSDADAPDEPPASPDPWRVRVPSWTAQDIVVPDVAVKAIRAQRLAMLREEPGADPLNGHALLTRLKLAVALMALEGRTVIDTNDWSLAGYVMEVSAHTRERCVRELRERNRRTNTARALAVAERDEVISERKLQRCREAILRWVDRAEGEPVTRRELTQKLKSDVRTEFDAAIAELTDDGRIAPVKTPKGVAYRSNVGTEVQRASPAQVNVGPRANVGPSPTNSTYTHRRRNRNSNRTSQQPDKETPMADQKAPPDKPAEPSVRQRPRRRQTHGRCPDCGNHIPTKGHSDTCMANIL